MGRETVDINDVDAPKNDSFIYLKVDRDMKKIFVSDIKYIESWKDYVKISLSAASTSW